MLRSRRLFAGILALISSCGTAPGDGDADPETRDVSLATPVSVNTNVNANPNAAAVAPSMDTQEATDAPARPASAFLGFHGVGGRWAIFASASGSVKIYDGSNGQEEAFEGEPFLSANGSADAMEQFGVPARQPSEIARTSVDGHLLLLHDARGVRVADLIKGVIVASLAGRFSGASLGDHDRVVEAWTAQEAYVLGIDDGQRATLSPLQIGQDLPAFTWDPESVRVAIKGVEHIFARDTWAEWQMPVGAKLLRHTNDGGFVFKTDHALEIWGLRDRAPRVRVSVKTDVTDIFVGAKSLAWAEEQADSRAAQTFHVVDTETLAETIFPAVGDCPVGGEGIVAIDADEVRTDVNCNPGCASIPYQEEFLVYDRRSGKKVRAESGPSSPPLTQIWEREIARIEAETARLGTSKENAIERPGPHGSYLFTEGGAFVLGDGRTGRVVTRFERAEQAGLVSFSGDGALVAGAGGVWDTRTGKRLFAIE